MQTRPRTTILILAGKVMEIALVTCEDSRLNYNFPVTSLHVKKKWDIADI